MVAAEIRVISSMATRQLLAELAQQFEQRHALRVSIESVGGVDAAKRVQAGEAFDAVVLASNAIDQLVAGGHAKAGSRVDIVRSGVAVAVRSGSVRPPIESEDALRTAVLAARTLGYSTGPSGTHLLKLFERWGIADTLRDRIVQAPPGVPVGSMVADGRVELGFQQFSELVNLPGIDVLGPLPGATQIVTTFSGAIVSTAADAAGAQRLLAFMAEPGTAATKQRHGMEPAAD